MDYLCDYCNKLISVNSRKKHIDGLEHKIAYEEYWAKYKKPIEIYEKEIKKVPCSRFHQKKYCKFSQFCQFSHYTKDQLDNLKNLHEKVLKQKRKVIKFENEGTSSSRKKIKTPKIRADIRDIPSLQDFQFDLNQNSVDFKWN